jgi:hypothetical protein
MYTFSFRNKKQFYKLFCVYKNDLKNHSYKNLSLTFFLGLFLCNEHVDGLVLLLANIKSCLESIANCAILFQYPVAYMKDYRIEKRIGQTQDSKMLI